MTATRSPTLNAVTLLPIPQTVPDGSAPGTSGNTAPREIAVDRLQRQLKQQGAFIGRDQDVPEGL